MAVLLADTVAAHPDAPAVIDAAGTTTWRNLDQRVNGLVGGLRARGLEVGDTVVAMLGNQAELVEVSLACLHGGWVLVPVNWHWVADEVAHVLGDADASSVVVDRRWTDVVSDALEQDGTPDVGIRIVCGDVGEGGAGEGDEGEDFEEYDAVLGDGSPGDPPDQQRGGPMFYTSGTTGRPKGVRNTLTSTGGPPEVFTLVAHSLRELVDLPADGGGVQAICGPMYHSAQWIFAMTAVACGATVVLQHRFDADELLTLIDRHEVTNLHLVPTQMRRMLDLPDERRSRFDGSSLRAVLHGAAPCPPEVKRRWVDWVGPIVTEYYGGTEAGFLTRLTAKEWLAHPGSVGRATPMVEIAAFGPDGSPREPNEEGDLYFRSLVGNDFEYHKAPDKTSSAHLGDGWGSLGDVGYIDTDGYLYLSDRKIDMIVSGGVNIYPAEIEGVLVEHSAVADVAVFGVPDDDMGEQVRAAVALRPGRSWSDELQAELEELSRERLAHYKCPRSFEVHAKLPRNDAGKLEKPALRDPHWAGRDRRI